MLATHGISLFLLSFLSLHIIIFSSDFRLLYLAFRTEEV